MAKKKKIKVDKTLSDFEITHLMCEVCGSRQRTPMGIKVHKGKCKCWGEPPSPEVIALIEVPDKPIEEILKKEETVEVIKREDALKPASPEPPPEEVAEVAEVPTYTVGLSNPAESVTLSTESVNDSSFTEPTPEEVSKFKVKYINPKLMGITNIPLNTTVELKGSLFFIDPSNSSHYTPEVIEKGIEGTITREWPDQNGQIWYDISTPGKTYICLKTQIIPAGSSEPQVRIIQLGAMKAEEFSIPLDRKSEFAEAVHEYADARDAKLEAENLYKEVDKVRRSTLIDYVTEYGNPTEEGKRDSEVIEDGYRVFYSYKQGSTQVKRNEEKIIAYLIKNNLHHAYRSVPQLDLKVWDSLVQEGVIPGDFVDQVQEKVTGNPTRRLYVEKAEK